MMQEPFSGVETENSSTGGITKISDVIEDFSYTISLPSHIDGKPIGALHWIDLDYYHDVSLQAVKECLPWISSFRRETGRC